MRVTRDSLPQLIPHQGAMCLLDDVSEFDDKSIVCISESHLRPDHPLARDTGLSAVHALEYAVQAVAAHGSLTNGDNGNRPHPGLLVALRDTEILRDRLDTLAAPLMVTAWRLLHDGNSMIYEFKVSAADELIAAGRATIICQTGADK